jgi:hypothetical protein
MRHLARDSTTTQQEIALALLEAALLERVDDRWRLIQVATMPEVVHP